MNAELRDNLPQTLTITIRPTANCNLRCKYCYAAAEPGKEMMSKETVKTVIDKIVHRCDKSQTKFLWHGSEPMLAGLNFYRFVVETQKMFRSDNIRIDNAMQTNGTLITDEWADFFKENNFGIGISLDGPREMNDLTRPFVTGKGSFDAIKCGMDILRAHDVKFGCLVVLNSSNAHSIDELIDYFKTEGVGFEIIPFVPFGRGMIQSDLALRESEYSCAQLRIFERWLEEGGDILESATIRFVSPFFTDGGVCTFRGGCQKRFIGVDFDANVYPCNRVCGDRRFLYGNLLASTFQDILNHPLRLKLCEFKGNYPPDCRDCSYVTACNGGCLADRLLGDGLEKVHPFCKEYQTIFKGIATRISHEIEGKEEQDACIH